MSETPDYITAAEARSLLPHLSFEQVSRMLAEHSQFDKIVLYTHYLIARGEIADVIAYLDSFDAVVRRDIVRTTLYSTYFGNALHACAYWNTGYNALALYRYLINCGADQCIDYYEHYPWEMDGISYVCPIHGRNVAPDRERNFEEFAETYGDIRRYFPHAGAAGAAAAAELPAFLPVTPSYSWSECEVTPAGGAGLGPGAAAENVQNCYDRLLAIWMNDNDSDMLDRATSAADALSSAIDELNAVSDTQVAPWHRTRKLLSAHAACFALYTLMAHPSSTSDDEFVVRLRAAKLAVAYCSFETVDTTHFAFYYRANTLIQALERRESSVT